MCEMLSPSLEPTHSDFETDRPGTGLVVLTAKPGIGLVVDSKKRMQETQDSNPGHSLCKTRDCNPDPSTLPHVCEPMCHTRNMISSFDGEIQGIGLGLFLWY